MQSARGKGLTKGDAVGPSRMASSSSVKGSRGTTSTRSGTRAMMMSGNPIAAADASVERGIIGREGENTDGLNNGHRCAKGEEFYECE